MGGEEGGGRRERWKEGEGEESGGGRGKDEGDVIPAKSNMWSIVYLHKCMPYDDKSPAWYVFKYRHTSLLKQTLPHLAVPGSSQHCKQTGTEVSLCLPVPPQQHVVPLTNDYTPPR